MPQSRCEALIAAWEASPTRRLTLEQVFWPKVQKGGPDDCWPWLGAHGPSGHGVLRILKTHLRATAVAYWFGHGVWPGDGKHVCHRCDNPPCVNPAHLFLGSALDNMQDCIAKGRFKFPAPQHGEANNKAKLTTEQVDDIRDRYRNGESVSELARRFGVARSTVAPIVKGRNWQAAGVAPVPVGPTTTEAARLKRDELAMLYHAGVKQSDIARRCGVSPQHVSTTLRRMGLRALGPSRGARRKVVA